MLTIDSIKIQIIEKLTTATIFGKPSSYYSKKKIDISWSKVGIRKASSEDISILKTWLKGDKEIEWIGALKDKSLEEQFSDWITNSLCSCVLTYKPSPSKKTTIPVAFANIALFGNDQSEPDIEIGRLVVAPDYRRRGFGSTLLRHLASLAAQSLAASSFYDNFTHIRTCKDNVVAIEMINKLPFNQLNAPGWASSHDMNAHFWFRFRNNVKPSKIGTQIRTIREEMELSQAMLAFYCGVKRPTINMIESGRRKPSFDLLRTLSYVLCKTEIERVKFLLAAIGDLPSLSLHSYKPLSKEKPLDNDNLWVITDWLAETIDAEILESSRGALRKGKERWFFIPHGKWAEEGSNLIELFGSPMIDKEMLKKHLRIFEAPEVLCRLRLAITNPKQKEAENVSVEGENGNRVPLSKDIASQLLMSIRKIVLALEDKAKRGEQIEIKGFRLVHPKAIK